MMTNGTRTHIDTLSGIRTYGLSVQAIKAYVSDRSAVGIGELEKIWKEAAVD
jgi:hypothetical protein